jgi:hypothetical protein
MNTMKQGHKLCIESVFEKKPKRSEGSTHVLLQKVIYRYGRLQKVKMYTCKMKRKYNILLSSNIIFKAVHIGDHI